MYNVTLKTLPNSTVFLLLPSRWWDESIKSSHLSHLTTSYDVKVWSTKRICEGTPLIAFELGEMDAIIRRSECIREIQAHNTNRDLFVKASDNRFFDR